MNFFSNTNNNKRYYTLDYFYHQRFNSKVFKVSLNAGFSCPNIDGTVGYGGCIYCSNMGSGEFAGNKNDDLIEQFNKVKEVLHKMATSKIYWLFSSSYQYLCPLSILKENMKQFWI